MAEQKAGIASETTPAIAPDRADAVDVVLHAGRHAAVGHALPRIHRHVPPQRLETGMHLGRYGACHGAGRRVGRPQLRVGVGFRQILADRQAVPDHQIAAFQRRYLAGGSVTQNLLLAVRLVEGDHLLGEILAGHLQRQPGAQRPGGIILVTDDERDAVSSFRNVAHASHSLSMPGLSARFFDLPCRHMAAKAIFIPMRALPPSIR